MTKLVSVEILKEAREMVEHWAGYASTYFTEKHDLAGDLAKLDAAIKAADEPSPPQRCCCGTHEWPEGTMKIEDSRGVLHFAERPCHHK